MATGKKDATVTGETGGRRAPSGSLPQDKSDQRVKTYRVVVIKDGVVVAGRQRRRRGLAS